MIPREAAPHSTASICNRVGVTTRLGPGEVAGTSRILAAIDRTFAGIDGNFIESRWFL
jgi:hypothetical protein